MFTKQVGRVEKITNKLPKPSVPGPWASIVVDYNRKTGADKPDGKSSVDGLFGPNSLPGSPQHGEVSPYGDTALLATDIDLAKEKPMDVATFKNFYLSDNEERDRQVDENPWRSQYLSWVRGEARKEARATTRVEKVQVDDVELAAKKITKWRRRTDDETQGKVDEYLKQHERKFLPQTIEPELDAKYQEQQEPLRQHNMFEDFALRPRLKKLPSEQVEIPADLKTEGWSLFKKGNEVYDKNGDFVYRIPT